MDVQEKTETEKYSIISEIPDHWLYVDIDHEIAHIGELIGYQGDLNSDYGLLYVEPIEDSQGDLVDYGRVFGCEGSVPYLTRPVWEIVIEGRII